MSRRDDPRALARLGWLITTTAMAAILVVASWLNYRAVRAAVDTLNLGQAELLGSAMRMSVRPSESEVDPKRLEEILAERAASGLTYVAVVGPGDSILAQAGSSAGPIVRPRGRGLTGTTLIRVGSRMRAFQMRPPVHMPGRSEGRRRAPDEQPGPPGDSGRAPGEAARRAGDGRPPRDFYWNVIDFDPVAADVLAGGRRNLGMSILAAAFLVSLAVLSWRTSERNEATRRAMEEQRRLAVLGEMSAVLAHEIRNPLASLKGNAQLVAEKLPAESPDRARVARVVSEADRLDALTADLLDFARTGPLHRSNTDPVALTRQLIEDVGGPFELLTGGDARLWAVDAGRMRQALFNVLMNARQASNGGTVTVRVHQGADALVFEIRDVGEGLPPGSEGRIFDPFFTTRTSGTGLGLAVARGAVEQQGGRIEAANHPEGGAVFRISIPAWGAE